MQASIPLPTAAAAMGTTGGGEQWQAGLDASDRRYRPNRVLAGTAPMFGVPGLMTAGRDRAISFRRSAFASGYAPEGWYVSRDRDPPVRRESEKGGGRL